MVWSDTRDLAQKGDIYGARITAQGVVLDPSGAPLATGVQHDGDPNVAWSGTDYSIAFVRNDGGGVAEHIAGLRVDASPRGTSPGCSASP